LPLDPRGVRAGRRPLVGLRFNTGTSWQGMEALKKVFFEND
jgi:hypothetical protein